MQREPSEPFDLDAQATTPLAPEALSAMLPLLEHGHWNPHSAHRGGRRAKAALEAARARIAAALGHDPAGLIFTAGATESNNLALKGMLAESPGRLVTFATEHSCVLEAARHLERLGTPVTILPVTANGLPDLDALRATLRQPAALVSCMAVNNEIGAIAPLTEIAAIAREAGALFHSDAAQAFGKIGLSQVDADLISLSAHKLHGPKGIGALWVRPGIRLAPQLDGGGQEAGVRSGTQSPALAAGFAAAAVADPDATRAHCAALMEIALDSLRGVPHRINGPDPLGGSRWPGNLSVTFPGVTSSRLIARLPDLAISSGSACSSGAGRPSHVLAALGLPADQVNSTIRLGWSRLTEAAPFAAALAKIAATAKDMGR